MVDSLKYLTSLNYDVLACILFSALPAGKYSPPPTSVPNNNPAQLPHTHTRTRKGTLSQELADTLKTPTLLFVAVRSDVE